MLDPAPRRLPQAKEAAPVLERLKSFAVVTVIAGLPLVLKGQLP